MILHGFSRGLDPINNEELDEHVSITIGKVIGLYITPDEVVVWGDDISEADRSSIQAAIDSYVYVNPDPGVPGPQGPAGNPGESAYEVWIDEGNIGTEEEFLESLVGADGSPGAEGPPGPPGEVSTFNVDGGGPTTTYNDVFKVDWGGPA